MRSGRFPLLFLAIYLIFLGGSAYFGLIFPVRVLHHAVMTLLLAFWLIVRIRRSCGLPRTPLNPALYAAVAVWFVSALASIDPRMALENVWFPVVHVLLFFGLVDLLQRGRQRIVFETQFFVAALVVLLSALEVASWYFGLGILPGTQTGWAEVIGSGIVLPLKPPRLALAMSISTLLAGYVAPLVTLAIGWALTAGTRSYRRALWLLAGALVVVLFFTFSRGGLISLGAALATLGGLAFSRSSRMPERISLRSVGVVAALVGVAAAALLIITSLNASRSYDDQVRVDMWRSALVMTRDDPTFGVGPGEFGRAFRSYRNPANVQDKLVAAHNLYLNTAAETGLVGVAVGLWLLVVFVRTWARNRRDAASWARKLRLEAAFAALVGMAFHSLVDVFTTTPLVLLIALLAAYCVTGHRLRQDTRPAPDRLITSVVALIIVVGFGLWFIPMDIAQAHHMNSLNGGELALAEARAAASTDPGMRLYRLQTDYLQGQQLGDAAAETAYQDAVALEPTWDTGWLNLAALAERRGDLPAALDALDHARRISHLNTAILHWARLAEQTNAASAAEIVDAYTSYMTLGTFTPPYSGFWDETPLRRQALDTYLNSAPEEVAYRVLAVHDPERAAALVPDAPATAAQWWMAGEHALIVEGDADTAAEGFTEAIRRAPANGDYYAARARAEIATQPDAGRRDLDIAELLGTTYEYPNIIRIGFAATPEERYRARADALPPVVYTGEFAAVLYGRPATFRLFPEVRGLGPGRAVMGAWYDIAVDYVAEGKTDEAANVYRAILDYAPDEQAAREALAALTPS